jgi:hypothetical protein
LSVPFRKILHCVIPEIATGDCRESILFKELITIVLIIILSIPNSYFVKIYFSNGTTG